MLVLRPPPHPPAASRLETITAPGKRVWSYLHNTLGQKTQYTHPNGTRTEYGYDTRHRLTSIVHKDASNNAVLDSFTFTLDTEGNITHPTPRIRAR